MSEPRDYHRQRIAFISQKGVKPLVIQSFSTVHSLKMTAEARRRREEELSKTKCVGTEKIATWLRSAPPRLCGQNQKEKVDGNEIQSYTKRLMNKGL
jgi:hypothetical protein